MQWLRVEREQRKNRIFTTFYYILDLQSGGYPMKRPMKSYIEKEKSDII